MMKKALKLTFGTVVAIGSLGTAHAFFDEIDFVNGFGVYVNGTYMKPSNNGLSYGDVFIGPGQEDRQSSTVFVEPDHEWDWGAGLIYAVPNSNTRVYFDYDHYSDTSDAGPTSELRNIDVQFPDDGVTNGGASVRHRSNEYSLGLSYLFKNSDRLYIDLRGQLSWDKYSRDFAEVNFDGVENAARATTSELRAFGPGVGVNVYGRPLTHCPAFGLFAGGMASVLYGKNEFAAVAVDQNGISYATFPENSRSMVGKLDIKFGVDWSSVYKYDQCSIGYGLALGMRYMNVTNAFKNGNSYFNPVNDGVAGVYPAGIVPVPGVTPIVGVQPTAGNWALNTGIPNDFGRFGPFLQFHVGGVNPLI